MYGTIASFYNSDEAELFLQNEAAEIVARWEGDDGD